MVLGRKTSEVKDEKLEQGTQGTIIWTYPWYYSTEVTCVMSANVGLLRGWVATTVCLRMFAIFVTVLNLCELTVKSCNLKFELLNIILRCCYITNLFNDYSVIKVLFNVKLQ